MKPTVDKKESPLVFEGFIQPKKNYFHMPNAWIDICAEIDNLAELKVVQYVLRHTWGYQEYGIAKAITVDEFMHGRKYQDGKSRMDNGTGLKSDRSVKDGLKAAIDHGYLVCEIDATDKARIKKSYMLKMAEGCDLPPEIGQVDATPHANEFRQVDATPLSGRCYPSDQQNLPLYQVDATPRSEKYTTRKTLKKNTEEKQECVDTSESHSDDFGSHEPTHTLALMQNEPSHAGTTNYPGKRWPDGSATLENGCTDDQDTTGPHENAPQHSPGSQGREPGAQRDTEQPPTREPGASREDGLSTSQASSPQESAKVETTNGSKKPGRGRVPKAKTEQVELTPKGRKVYEAWCSLFKSPPRATGKTIDCANDLHDRLVPWCLELRISCAALLKEIKGFLFATDASGFYKRGVTLCDVDRDFEKWQSAKTEEIERASRARLPRAAPSQGTVSGLRRLGSAPVAAVQS